MKCRICATEGCVGHLGAVTSPAGGMHKVYACEACGSRFAEHDPAVYEALHASASSVYGWQDEIAATAERLFAAKDRSGLKAYLSMLPKNAFVIETIEAMPDCRRVMELGCSRGYLTGYFILAGYDVVGVDVSSTAVEAAARRFGPHFFLPGAGPVRQREPFDAIYHVGTIGCVGDPAGFTNRLIGMLRPEGILVFNAPNAAACRARGTLWPQSAPPPDVVTLFDESFWQRLFSASCEVEVKARRRSYGEQARGALAALRGGQLGAALKPARIDEFGLMVKLTRRAGACAA